MWYTYFVRLQPSKGATACGIDVLWSGSGIGLWFNNCWYEELICSYHVLHWWSDTHLNSSVSCIWVDVLSYGTVPWGQTPLTVFNHGTSDSRTWDLWIANPDVIDKEEIKDPSWSHVVLPVSLFLCVFWWNGGCVNRKSRCHRQSKFVSYCSSSQSLSILVESSWKYMKTKEWIRVKCFRNPSSCVQRTDSSYLPISFWLNSGACKACWEAVICFSFVSYFCLSLITAGLRCIWSLFCQRYRTCSWEFCRTTKAE